MLVPLSVSLPASRHSTDAEVIERRDRVRLRPQSHTAGLEAGVTVVEIELAVEPRLHVIPHGHDTDGVPLPECWRLHACAGELAASAIVVVQPEIALERVGPDHVVLAVGEA